MTGYELQRAWGHFAPRGMRALSLKLQKNLLSRRLNRQLMQLAMLPSVYDVSWRGIKLRCHAADNATDYSVMFTRRGAEEMDRLLAELRSGDAFIDIGANFGIFALAASRAVGQQGRVLAIEPNPALVARLRFNIDANTLRNVTVVEAAVGDEKGTATLQLHDKELGQSSIVGEGKGARITVPMETLADICAAHGVKRIGALKIDVEGYEDRVLLPFLRTVPKDLWPRAILIEIVNASLWREGCLYHLQEMGYAKAWSGRHDTLLVRGA